MHIYSLRVASVKCALRLSLLHTRAGRYKAAAVIMADCCLAVAATVHAFQAVPEGPGPSMAVGLQAGGSPEGCPLDAAAAKKSHKKRVSQGPIDTY
jgi:hypothetical protein